MSAMVETLSLLSSLHDEAKSENYIEPHYKEWYRVAIDALIDGGITSYQEFLAKERVTEFLAEDEINYITNHVQKPVENVDNTQGEIIDDNSSSGTYWPIESDLEAPNLDLGWPYVAPGHIGATDISLYFHPPRGHPLTIKEMVRKMIKEARKVIAIVMDMFTDIDIFKELVEASTRGVPVYLLLDDVNFSHFLKMTEKQGFQVQRLRNMRVRTVKGQDYFSKSGAKFCGKMEQKFLLVDCEKAMYGTYSFMWSYEKVNLSMIQVITGKLVESFDEEFRTLYARSCIPTAFGPEESIIGKHKKIPWENGSYQNSLSSLLSASSQRSLFGRKDQMHTLDSSYLKSQNRFANNEEDKYNMRNASYRGFNVQNKINHFQQFERHDNWKRHSYAAGEKPETSPYLLLNRAMNSRINNHNHQVPWSRQPDTGILGSSSRGGYSSNYNISTTQSFANRLSQRLTTNVSERSSSVRRSFHGTDSHVRSVQQRMPTLEHTTKSFLRNWRIESYLNDHCDIPPDSSESIGDRAEVNDGAENYMENQMYSHSRLRSSILYKPTLSEQKEDSSCTTNSSHSNSTIVDSQGSLTPKANSPQNTRFQETREVNNFTSYDTSHAPHHHDMLKRHSLQVPDSSQVMTHGLNYNTNPAPSSYLYTTLSTNRQPQPDSIRKPNDNILKRRSLPLFEHRKVNIGQSSNIIPPNYIYNSLVRRQPEQSVHPNPIICNSTENLESNLVNVNESISENTVESIKGALSTETLDEDDGKDSPGKKESKGSPNFLKKGSKKLKSLLSLTPEKKETLSKNKAPAFYRMCSSSDTLVSEDDYEQNPKMSDMKNDSSPRREKTLSISQISLNKSKENVASASGRPNMLLSDASKSNQAPAQSIVENKFLENTGDVSAPRFNTEQIQFQDSKMQVQNKHYGRIGPPTIQREVPLRHPKDAIHRELSQREIHHSDMPPILQREMHLRHSQHRDMQQKELLRRDMNTVQPITEFQKPQEGNSSSLPRPNDRRVYSRFEQFCKVEHKVPSSIAQNSNSQVLDKNKGITTNYLRPHNSLSYSSNVYNSVQPNENKFGRFMQKFGSFIHKKQ